MATMDDIARRLGISKGTVSKALSGAGDVSEAMRSAVVEAAVELGYSRINRSLDMPKLAIFIENMAWQAPGDFGRDLITGFRQMAEPNGYAVSIIPLRSALQQERSYDEYMLMHDLRGAFFLGITLLDPWMNDFRTCRTPTVLLDNRAPQNPNVSQVGIDSDEGMEMAVRRFIELGHRTIGYLGGGLDSYIYSERYSAFFRALRKHGMDDDPSLAGCSYYESVCLETHLPRLLELGCTAIICSHDTLARSVLEACKSRHVQVPEDVSILGIDDLPICQLTEPTLSSLRQDRAALGKGAYFALSSQLSRIRISALKLHPELILRGSIGPAHK